MKNLISKERRRCRAWGGNLAALTIVCTALLSLPMTAFGQAAFRFWSTATSGSASAGGLNLSLSVGEPLSGESGNIQSGLLSVVQSGIIPTDVERLPLGAEVPTIIHLDQNYPNPFNPTTSISFDLSQPDHVVLTIFNVIGQEIARLVDGQLGASTHDVSWDATGFPTGLYFFTLRAGNFTETKTMILVK